MRNRIKVLFLPKWWPNKYDRWEGNFIENHAIAVKDLVDLQVLFVHSDHEMKRGIRIEENQSQGVNSTSIYFAKPRYPLAALNKISTAIRYIKAQRKGMKLLESSWGKADLFHLHILTRNALLPVWKAKRSGTPCLLTEHWSGYFPSSGAYKGWLKKRLSAWAVKNMDVVTTVSHYLEKAMRAHGLNGNYTQVSNVVDTQLFHPTAQKTEQEKIQLLHVSTLDTVPKNLPIILKAFAQIAASRTDVELQVLGDGKERANQEALARELGILNRSVFFHGNVRKEQVAEYMRNSDFLILYSVFENQPCVLIEAFASGIPVITSDVGGIPEIMDKSRGISLPPNDEKLLYEALNQMIQEKDHYVSGGLRSYAVEHFSNEKIGAQFLNIYQSLLKQ